MNINPSIKAILDSVMEEGTPVNAVAAQGTLTIDTQLIVGDTMTIGDKTYTFTTDGTAAAEGEIDVGADLADVKTLIPLAINGTDGNNTANTLVTSAAAFVSNDLTITAKTKGIAGDQIATTETFDAVTNIFDASTLGTTTAGVNGTPGKQGITLQDATYWYLCISDNSISDANWRRFAVGSVY